jgi:hypothetical protein
MLIEIRMQIEVKGEKQKIEESRSFRSHFATKTKSAENQRFLLSAESEGFEPLICSYKITIICC